MSAIPSNSSISKFQFSGLHSVNVAASGVTISGVQRSVVIASGGFYQPVAASGGGQSVAHVSISNVPTSESSWNV